METLDGLRGRCITKPMVIPHGDTYEYCQEKENNRVVIWGANVRFPACYNVAHLKLLWIHKCNTSQLGHITTICPIILHWNWKLTLVATRVYLRQSHHCCSAINRGRQQSWINMCAIIQRARRQEAFPTHFQWKWALVPIVVKSYQTTPKVACSAIIRSFT